MGTRRTFAGRSAPTAARAPAAPYVSAGRLAELSRRAHGAYMRATLRLVLASYASLRPMRLTTPPRPYAERAAPARRPLPLATRTYRAAVQVRVQVAQQYAAYAGTQPRGRLAAAPPSRSPPQSLAPSVARTPVARPRALSRLRDFSRPPAAQD